MGGVTHLRGQTPETLVQAFPGLAPPVARRVVHRLVGEQRDDLDGVPGLSKARARELARAGAPRPARDPRPAAQRRRPVRQVPVPRRRRSRVRVGAHSARAAALQHLRLVAGRLRARLPLLRDGTARLPAQPRAVGDGRAGAANPQRVARASHHRRRVPGPGRAATELRQRDTGGECAAPSLRRAHRSRPHHDLDRRAAAAARALHRGAPAVSADPVADVGVLREARAAGADHRALRGRGAGGGRRAGWRRYAAGPCSSRGC